MKRFIAAALAVAALAAVGAFAAAGTASAHPAKRMSEILMIKPGSKKGPDGKMHDAYLGRTSFHVTAGERVTLTVFNYDGGEHSFDAPGLGVDRVVPGAISSVHPSQTTISFVARRAGSFQWYCKIPCDGEAGHWAMNPRHENYMGGIVTVTA